MQACYEILMSVIIRRRLSKTNIVTLIFNSALHPKLSRNEYLLKPNWEPILLINKFQFRINLYIFISQCYTLIMPLLEDIKKRRSGSTSVATNKTHVFCFDRPIGDWGKSWIQWCNQIFKKGKCKMFTDRNSPNF